VGGPGSGARYDHGWRPTKKTTVESCLSIDANRWMREGILKNGVRQSGVWRWTYRSRSGFSVHYEVSTLDSNNPRIRLSYSWSWTSTGQQESADYHVPLTTTSLYFGGLRWWFVCPLVINERPCRRRAGKLYLPGNARYFGCRRCHHLAYTSSQEAHKGDGVLGRIAADVGVSLGDVRRALRRRWGSL